MTRRASEAGFTLLEVMISMAILAVSLVAILDLHSGAVRMYNHSKFLTVASLLARSKMVDVEEKLYDEPFPDFDDEETGTFDKEGYPNFKWKADIVKPNVKVDPTQLIDMVGKAMGVKSGDLSSLDGSQPQSNASGGPTSAQGGGLTGMIGPMVAQLGPLVNQSIREVRLTVSWTDITGPSSMTVVTHVVKVPGQAAPGSAAQQQQDQAQQRLQQLRNRFGNLPNLPPALQRAGIIPAAGGGGSQIP